MTKDKKRLRAIEILENELEKEMAHYKEIGIEPIFTIVKKQKQIYDLKDRTLSPDDLVFDMLTKE